MMELLSGLTLPKTSFSQLVTGQRKSSEYGTPLELFEKLHSIFNFGIDPCALESEPNRLNLARIYTKAENGLEKKWNDNTFINPPFGTKKGENIRAWINKMRTSSTQHPNRFYVMLLPARIESNWFQEEIFTDPKGIVYVIKGRLKFYNPVLNKNEDPHPIGSVLYIRGMDITSSIAYELEDKIKGLYIHMVAG